MNDVLKEHGLDVLLESSSQEIKDAVSEALGGIVENSPCPVCGGIDEHNFTNDVTGDIELSVDQWRKIHSFVYHAYLPFIHSVITDSPHA